MIREYKRFICTIALLILAIFAPWWIYAPLLFLALVYFPVFWEGILIAFIAEALYAPIGKFFSVHFISIISLIIALAMIPLRERFRIN